MTRHVLEITLAQSALDSKTVFRLMRIEILDESIGKITYTLHCVFTIIMAIIIQTVITVTVYRLDDRVGYVVLTVVSLKDSMSGESQLTFALLASSFMLVSCFTYSSTLKMETVYSS
jgi:hypothetical protein